jgi:hypothetical protein
LLRFYLFLLGVGLSGMAYAAGDAVDPFDAYQPKSEYNESLEMPWVELETRVRNLPRDEDLTEIKLDRLPASLRLYGDFKNIDINDQDLITRLWLVARSRHGAYNGSYEGFRCATQEYKAYAYANPERSEPLRVVRFPQWREVRRGSYRHELMRDIICSDTLPAPANNVIDNLTKESSTHTPLY